MNHTKKTIETAYAALERLCEDMPGPSGGLFERLVCAAATRERNHRRNTRGKYRSSVVLVSKYYTVLCTYADVPSAVREIDLLAHLATLREDYQIGAMLGAYLRTNAALPTLPEGFNAIDYARDLV